MTRPQGSSLPTPGATLGRPMRAEELLARRQALSGSLLAAALVLRPPGIDQSALAVAQSTAEEVAAVLNGLDWESAPPYVKGDFRRLDETDDAIFYDTPRLVYHIDDNAVAAATSFYGKLFGQVAQRRQVEKLDVLDLCSSWVSHYPPKSAEGLSRVAGLGMNAEELKKNPQLTEWSVADLNKEPCRLPYESASFDVVTCTVSIDYLTRPLAVIEEVARVLRPGGSVAILFSNRLFFSKAVALWTGKDDLEHVYTVGSYVHYGAPTALSDPEAIDLTPKASRKNGDPLYAVVAMKR